MVSSFLSEFVLVTGSYLAIFVLTLMAINWLLGGLFKPYMRVKGSRGKLVLVKVKNMVADYFVTGKVAERMLIFTDRKKEERRITIPQDRTGIYRSLGVSCIDIDDEKSAVLTYSNALVTGFDAVKFNDLYTRALNKPSLVDNKQMIMIVILVIIAIGVAAGIMVDVKNGKLIQSLVEISKSTITTIPK